MGSTPRHYYVAVTDNSSDFEFGTNGISEIGKKERITTPAYYVAKYLVLNKYAYCVHRMC